MDIWEAIQFRRSIRKYGKQNVSDDQVRKLLQAAMMAPSAMNAQPWHFVLVSDPAMLAEIAAQNPNAEMTKDAPLAILVCADLDLEQAPGFWPQDCSAAVQNLLLAAHALGLGAVWTGIYPQEKSIEGYRQLFHLPPNVMPHSLIPVGYPAESPTTEDRFQADRIHRGRWSGE
jgi:nitroreductase